MEVVINGIKPRRKYDRAFKQETVRLITEVGRSAPEVAKELGINVNVIYRWVRQYKTDQENSFPGKGHQKPDDAEIHRLRKQLADMTEERDILKKVVSIFPA
jgi:transposase